jgi:hypothetical protein
MDLTNYRLAVELAKVGNFNVSNISMALKNNDNIIEGDDYIKSGGTVLLNKKSTEFPKYITQHLHSEQLTDLTGLIPYSYFLEEVKGKVDLLAKNKMFDTVNISGKKFTKILDSKLKKAFSEESTRNVNSVKEWPEIEQYIDGYITLNQNLRLTWY